MSKEIDIGVVNMERLRQNVVSEEKIQKLLNDSKNESICSINIREYLLKLGVTDQYLEYSLKMTRDAEKSFTEFMNEFGIQAMVCSVYDDKIVQLIIAVFKESTRIAGKIATLQGVISNAQMELYMTAHRLHEHLMGRKLGESRKPTVTSPAMETMFKCGGACFHRQ